MNREYAKGYAQLYRTHWWWRAREEFLVGVLRDRLPRKATRKLLDVGCGAGLFFHRLETFGEVYGIEPDTSMRTGCEAIDARIHWGSLDTFPISMRLTAVLMLDVLEHLDRPEEALRIAANLLEPGGIVVATVPAFMSIWTQHDVLNQHRTRYTKTTFKPLVAAAGLEPIDYRYYFNWLWPVKRVVRMLEELQLIGDRPSVPSIPSSPVNRALFGLSRMEQRLGLSRTCPFGSSLLFVGVKRA